MPEKKLFVRIAFFQLNPSDDGINYFVRNLLTQMKSPTADKQTDLISPKPQGFDFIQTCLDFTVSIANDFIKQGYSHIESGRAELKIEDLAQLCKFYNVSADYIIGLTDEKRSLK